jgi:hypothetical protein
MASSKRVLFGGVAVVTGLAAGVAGACSSAGEGDSMFAAGGSAPAAGSGGGGGIGAAATGGGGTGGNPILLDAAPSDASMEACATSSATATMLPSYLELVVDISGSMCCKPTDPPTLGCLCPNPGSKWQLTRTAIESAVGTLPATVSAGVILYPYQQSTSALCFANKAAVPMALLDNAHKQLIKQVLDNTAAMGATPTEDAYLFGTQAFGGVPSPSNKFIVLITDGMPTVAKGCKGDGHTPVPMAPIIADAAAAAQAGIKTFVIGSPGSEGFRSDLSKMATAGGTPQPGCSDTGPTYCHLDMTTKPDFGKAIADALNAIAGTALSCEFDVPSPDGGPKLDPNLVNVLFTPGGGKADYVLQNKDPQCTEGWHYSQDGKQIILCTETCKKVQADKAGRIDIEFGCATKGVA